MLTEIKEYATLIILGFNVAMFIVIKFNDFSHLTKDFKETKEKLDKIDNKLDKVSERLSNIEGRCTARDC